MLPPSETLLQTARHVQTFCFNLLVQCKLGLAGKIAPLLALICIVFSDLNANAHPLPTAIYNYNGTVDLSTGVYTTNGFSVYCSFQLTPQEGFTFNQPIDVITGLVSFVNGKSFAFANLTGTNITGVALSFECSAWPSGGTLTPNLLYSAELQFLNYDGQLNGPNPYYVESGNIAGICSLYNNDITSTYFSFNSISFSFNYQYGQTQEILVLPASLVCIYSVPPITLSGHVYCTCDGSPISGASVQIPNFSTVTDTNGYYVFTNLPPGQYTTTVNANNFTDSTTNLGLIAGISTITNDFYLTNLTLVIDPIYDSSITSLPNVSAITNSIQSAIKIYQQYIANPLCIKILFSNTITANPRDLGESSTPRSPINYAAYLEALGSRNNANWVEATALAYMPSGPNNGVIDGNPWVFLTAANFAAIGQTSAAMDMVNANQGYYSIVGINFDAVNDSRPNQNPSKFDLQFVTLHEVDEALGIGGSGSTLHSDGLYIGQPPPTDGIGPLDLFRYSSPTNRSFTYDTNVLAYFSIDNGVTIISHFNQYGNGQDFGDWGDGANPADGKANIPPQVQDAVGTPGATVNWGGFELIALDVIGYNVVAVPPNPHPTRVTGGQLALNWNATPVQKYEVQYSTDLVSWNDLNSPVLLNGFNATAVDANATDSQRFYRIMSLSPSTSSAVVTSQPKPANSTLKPASIELFRSHLFQPAP